MKYRFTETADRDVANCLEWSYEKFGYEAAERYAELIIQAVRDLADESGRPGAKFRAEFGLWFYHLRYSRDHVQSPKGKVGSPKHFIVFEASGDQLVIVRVLHDSMDFESHLET